MFKRFFTEESDLQESDLETDSEDESKGCSQKYQLRGNYVKKFKSKTVVSKVEDDATVAATEAMEDEDDATVAATEAMGDDDASVAVTNDEDDDATVVATEAMEDDDATVVATDDQDDATVATTEDEDDAADAVARVHNPRSMKEKSEDWLKWLRGHYTHDKEWP
jgi:hypothetical protein